MDELTTDEIFDVLGHSHRRHALSALMNCNGKATVTELVEKTSYRIETPPERVEVGLHHSHLPRLEGLGVVEYDSETNVVELTDTASDLEPFVKLVDE
ncbi:ArsR family transcriptional regulator [Haladaptatus pallidirubidus]|uniref:DUF7344 domain-containing protein n=1 Tax=Haladaptatus pallidirubidus TaxID=1008152 RepID=A0AAV3UCQ3_9EURY|nr:ArsR family transcriptional regulator [Haladaptatus pallidirubidus]